GRARHDVHAAWPPDAVRPCGTHARRGRTTARNGTPAASAAVRRGRGEAGRALAAAQTFGREAGAPGAGHSGDEGASPRHSVSCFPLATSFAPRRKILC